MWRWLTPRSTPVDRLHSVRQMREYNCSNDVAASSPLIASLFAPGVVASELREPGRVELLYPSEAALCARFAPKRTAEFAAGRLCARRGLAALGIVDVAIDINADRSPRWPDGVTGSITHTTGFCGAVVAEIAHFRSIGLDAEHIGRITPEMQALLFTDDEAIALAALDDERFRRAQTIVFSAKEAFYKCQYQITHAWRDFHDVAVELVSGDMYGGDFVVTPSRTTSVTDWGVPVRLRGRFRVTEELALTGIALPPDAMPV